MSTRLTKQIRDAIVTKLVWEAENKRCEAQAVKDEALALRVVEARCGKGWRKKLGKVPENWLPCVDRVDAVYCQPGSDFQRSTRIYIGRVSLPWFGAYGGEGEAPLPEVLQAELADHDEKKHSETHSYRVVEKQVRVTTVVLTQEGKPTMNIDTAQRVMLQTHIAALKRNERSQWDLSRKRPRYR
jgi:hypothetical protein